MPIFSILISTFFGGVGAISSNGVVKIASRAAWSLALKASSIASSVLPRAMILPGRGMDLFCMIEMRWRRIFWLTPSVSKKECLSGRGGIFIFRGEYTKEMGEVLS